MSIILGGIRDLLKPGMWEACDQSGVDLDLVVDFTDDSVQFVDDRGNKTLCCNRHELQNNSYKSLFSSRLHKAIDKRKRQVQMVGGSDGEQYP